MEKLLKKRLCIETDLKTPNEQKDMDAGIEKWLKKELKKTKEALKEKGCTEDQYKSWVDTYLDAEYKKVSSEKWLTNHYMFIGMGGYDMTFPESQLQCFKDFIKHNGSAFASDPKEATEEEIKNAIALHCSDLG